ncbi:MAG TPA: hypothetical protein VD866_22115, partial [Urbifossiella sp.]|nr:hypothetical protein [Urbifossiella sp.]
MEADLLRRRLRGVGRRLLAVRTLGGLGWAAAAAVLLAVVAVWLDLLWELPPGARSAALVGTPLAGLLILGAAAWRAGRAGTIQAVAGQLDHAGGAAGRIRAGVDLLAVEAASPLTAGLAALAVADARELADHVPAARVAPVRAAARPFTVFLVLAAAAGTAAAAFPRLAETEWNRFTRPFADQAPFSRIVFRVEPGDTQIVFGQPLDVRATTEGPAVERLSLVLEPGDGLGEEVLPMFAEPGGAGRATVVNLTADARYHEGPLPKGGISGLPGTRVEVWAVSNRPLAGGAVRFTPPGSGPAALAPTSAGGVEVTGAFDLRAAGQARLAVTDADGQESAEAFAFSVSLLTDERPAVRL